MKRKILRMALSLAMVVGLCGTALAQHELCFHFPLPINAGGTICDGGACTCPSCADGLGPFVYPSCCEEIPTSGYVCFDGQTLADPGPDKCPEMDWPGFANPGDPCSHTYITITTSTGLTAVFDIYYDNIANTWLCHWLSGDTFGGGDVINMGFDTDLVTFDISLAGTGGTSDQEHHISM